jgi:hypothetical protein
VTEEITYVDRNLERRVDELGKSVEAAVNAMMRKHAATGQLMSGATITALKQEALKALTQEFSRAAQFTYNRLGNVESSACVAMDVFCQKAEFVIVHVLKRLAPGVGLAPVDIEPHILQITDELKIKSHHLLDDFSQGMLGDEKLKKEPSVSIVNTQTNSPGAIQQVGSNFNQSAFNQNHQSLVQEIDKALASPQFAALKPEEQLEVRDLADAVKLEAEKAAPDVGKLKRWGDKLVKVSEDVGLKVVSGTIAGLLLKMYTGG